MTREGVLKLKVGNFPEEIKYLNSEINLGSRCIGFWSTRINSIKYEAGLISEWFTDTSTKVFSGCGLNL